MGSDTGPSDEWPSHRVMLDDYWIDRHPVTNRQFAAFARETGLGGTEWRDAFSAGKEDHPVVRVSWDDARFSCVVRFPHSLTTGLLVTGY